jgi:hypothetical protein
MLTTLHSCEMTPTGKTDRKTGEAIKKSNVVLKNTRVAWVSIVRLFNITLLLGRQRKSGKRKHSSS